MIHLSQPNWTVCHLGGVLGPTFESKLNHLEAYLDSSIEISLSLVLYQSRNNLLRLWLQTDTDWLAIVRLGVIVAVAIIERDVVLVAWLAMPQVKKAICGVITIIHVRCAHRRRLMHVINSSIKTTMRLLQITPSSD